MISLAEYKQYKQITSTDQDAIITSMIPIAQDIIEKYINRVILSQTNTELTELKDNYIFTDNYPINRILYVGIPTFAIKIDGLTDGQSIHCDTAGLYFYSSPIATPTSFLFSVNTTLALLKTAVETAVPTLTLNLLIPATTSTSFLLQSTGPDILYASKFDGTFIKKDIRTIELVVLNSCVSLCSNEVYVIYTSGWDLNYVPQALKKIAFDMVSDLINVLSKSSNSGIKSESLGDYNYTLSDSTSNIAGDIVNKYKNDLEPFVKKWI